MAFGNLYRGKRVFVTGHTGFKGSWLAEWLLSLGAEVTGFALPPNTDPALFTQLELDRRLHHIEGDVRKLGDLVRALDRAKPDFVFHLAAQPLVRLSYREPVETFAVNVLGTVNLLEAVRLSKRPCVVVVVTTDKCYENKEWIHSYREEDPMGGHDPYSASKGAAELVVSSYRRSYFSSPTSSVQLASARAGNVIGGGDWALDRIVPDCIRALQANQAIPVRNKVATRPWQNVLEPLSGYLWLAAALSGQLAEKFPFPVTKYAGAFNFGPQLASNRTVAELVQTVLQHWPGTWQDESDPNAPHEASLLNLSIDKAHHLLCWTPVWSFSETVAHTVKWYHGCQTGEATPSAATAAQIDAYTTSARTLGCAWAS